MKTRSLLLPASAILLSSFAGLQAATIAFSEDFNSYSPGNTTPANFTESNGNDITLVDQGGGDIGYRFDISGSESAASAVQLTNSGGTSFTSTIQFTIDSLTTVSDSMNASMVILGSSGLGSGYRIGMNFIGGTGGPGSLFVMETGTAGNISPSAAFGGGTQSGNTVYSNGTLARDLNTLFTLSVTATYSGSTIQLAATLTNGTETLTVGATDTSVQTGQYFGPRVASNGDSNAATVTFDNFSVVPEPSSLGLLAIGLLPFISRRRH